MRYSKKSTVLTVEEYVNGIKHNNRAILARAITLVESNASKHLSLAQHVLQSILPDTGKSIRIGITGVPGAGKSTFIESFGLMLCQKGHKVAVLAIDPTSSLSRGSILGDKTRMEQLSRHPHAFVRPSPTGGTLGGVARKTRESILLCEAAGYDRIIVETVGVGQSEVTVRSMVDCFLVLMLTGAGDELQGMKKGMMELIDLLLIHKADGQNLAKAELLREEMNRILHLLTGNQKWEPKVLTASSITGSGLNQCLETIELFIKKMKETNDFEERRKKQATDWFYSLIEEQILSSFYENDEVKKELGIMLRAVTDGQLSPTKAALKLLKSYDVI
ncbi:putative periplasmic protein kinase ArgK and related GTPases of G3E family [Halalkalibacter wakoensis JCM 9140]|uniref:Putative periplasmic protein kinase ArgK and related GTPases of G3E family n=1 Tax=Halalkalibacter wakoensis JCM 9140 TaxID=1236970 RepID=W4Q2X4_9BACI|nr:methylmalonyl Co-A mutase-associated GTPase MeaB [Halalkalibacter wakoensis]GAE26342.1 putative periplasmic protein kinase ArgK and related GTPases of G3E family [Halalkalibacter wakoensis JCM 9140]